MTELRHPNWHELALFAREMNDELNPATREGTIKEAEKMLNPVLSKALQQFIIEVNDYGCYGISNMPAREWFNDDVRRPWADAISNLYDLYHAALKEADETPNVVVTELKAMQERLDTLTAELKSLREQEKPGDSEVLKDGEKPVDEEADKEKDAEDKPAEE